MHYPSRRARRRSHRTVVQRWSQCEVNADAIVAHVAPKELTVRRRPVIRLEQQSPAAARGIGIAGPVELEARPNADGRLPILLLRRLHVAGGHEANAGDRSETDEPTRWAELDATMQQRLLEVLRLTAEEILAATVHAQRTTIERDDQLGRLEREVLALEVRVVLAEEKLVADVGALVIDPKTSGERARPNRDGQADHVIGVDQIVRGDVE